MTNQQDHHIPVLLDAVLKYLDPQAGESYLDLTAGYGGHAAAILERTLQKHQAILVDRDAQACQKLRERFDDTVQIVHDDFWQAAAKLHRAGQQFDLILADLGVASPQLDDPARGFTFQASGPLDMRMDSRQALTASGIVNGYNQEQLAVLLREFGQEPKAWPIARAIVANRPIATTDQLAALVKRAWPGHSRVHPATRTFQALRLAVNDELGLLAKALPVWIDLLAPGGRLAVISFHSLEDRLVKQTLADEAGERYDARLRLLTRSPVSAAAKEIAFNPRSRSAKLRAAVKIKTEREAHAYSGKK